MAVRMCLSQKLEHYSYLISMVGSVEGQGKGGKRAIGFGDYEKGYAN